VIKKLNILFFERNTYLIAQTLPQLTKLSVYTQQLLL